MKFALIASAGAAFMLTGCASLTHSETPIHVDHAHVHGQDCGHTAIAHNDHVDYLHDGHLHHIHDGHVDEHVIEVSAANPIAENPITHSHADGHVHAVADGDHPMIPHGDHMDFLHNGHLHHVHGDHIDEHGEVAVVEG